MKPAVLSWLYYR